jgi:two-component system, LytTR family, response regulator
MDPVIKVFITEDDPFSRNQIKDLLEDYYPHLHISGYASSIFETRQFLLENKIDLLFLDIELPDGKGFDLLSSMYEVNFEVIITTAHGKYALDAIHYSALDYLVKPVQLAEFKMAMDRFSRKFTLGHSIKTPLPAGYSFIQKIPLPTLEGFVFIDINEIVHLDADRSYSNFYLKDGRKIIVSKPMNEFEERLIHHDFFRVHKSHIINLNQVVKYVRGEGGYVVMSNNTVIPVSRHHKDDFLKIIGNL